MQHFLEARAWKNSDKLIVMASRLASELSQISKVSLKKIDVIPHFVWPCGVAYSADQMEARRKLRKALLFGVIRRNKGIEDFIESCMQSGDIRGVVAGFCPDKGYEESLRARVAATSGKVEFLNRFVTNRELPNLYATCSVAVFPYTSFSSQSGALYLAAANETPVVGSDAGAIGVTIERENIGIVFPRGEVRKLSEALSRIHEPHEYFRAHAAARVLKQEQSVEAVCTHLARLYLSLN
jgi:glycosyltransferase involved in cell wall biosynthesis